MIAYHLDRSGALKEGDLLTLFQTDANRSNPATRLYGFDHVSRWGLFCYECLKNPFEHNNLEILNSLQIDLNAENIRQKFFPQLPSRFKSIFAVKDLQDFNLWSRYLHLNEHSQIFEIEYDISKSVELDANFLRGGIGYFDIPSIETIQNYWSGQMSDFPLPELLVPLPVTVGKLVSRGKIIF